MLICGIFYAKALIGLFYTLESQESASDNKKYDSIINKLPEIRHPGKYYMRIFKTSSIFMLLLQLSQSYIFIMFYGISKGSKSKVQGCVFTAKSVSV